MNIIIMYSWKKIQKDGTKRDGRQVNGHANTSVVSSVIRRIRSMLVSACVEIASQGVRTIFSQSKKYRASDKWKKQKRAYDLRIRLEALSHYGEGFIQCNCCGEKDHRFLSFDHINGGGRKHLLSIKGYKIGQWLRKHNYPEGYQILCHNCNMGKGIYGICPHKI